MCGGGSSQGALHGRYALLLRPPPPGRGSAHRPCLAYGEFSHPYHPYLANGELYHLCLANGEFYHPCLANGEFSHP